MDELAGGVPAPRRVRPRGHAHARLAHAPHGVDLHVQRAPRVVELRDELGRQPSLALARRALALDPGLLHVERRIHPRLCPGQPVDEVGTKAIGAVGFREDAVDDHVDVGVEAILHRLRGRTVRGGELAVPVGLVGHGRQLGHGVGGAVWVRGARGATARDDLDVVGAFFE